MMQEPVAAPQPPAPTPSSRRGSMLAAGPAGYVAASPPLQPGDDDGDPTRGGGRSIKSYKWDVFRLAASGPRRARTARSGCATSSRAGCASSSTGVI